MYSVNIYNYFCIEKTPFSKWATSWMKLLEMFVTVFCDSIQLLYEFVVCFMIYFTSVPSKITWPILPTNMHRTLIVIYIHLVGILTFRNLVLTSFADD